MNLTTLFKYFHFWPPFLGAGIKVKEFKEDFSFALVQMKMRFWNKNYMGTHFGGSLYAMTDAFYVLMLTKRLGPDYIVWDKSATIRYKIPARGTMFARFEVSQELVNDLKAQLETEPKVEPTFIVSVTDSNGVECVVVEKTLHIKRKHVKL